MQRIGCQNMSYINQSFQILSKVMAGKQFFLQQENQHKLTHKTKKLKANYQEYIEAHKKMPLLYQRMTQIFLLMEKVVCARLRNVFVMLKNTNAKIQEKDCQDIHKNVWKRQGSRIVKTKVIMLIKAINNLFLVKGFQFMNTCFIQLRKFGKNEYQKIEVKVCMPKCKLVANKLQQMRILCSNSNIVAGSEQQIRLNKITNMSQNSILCLQVDVSISQDSNLKSISYGHRQCNIKKKSFKNKQLNNLKKNMLIKNLSQIQNDIANAVRKHRQQKQGILKLIQNCILKDSKQNKKQQLGRSKKNLQISNIQVSNLQSFDTHNSAQDQIQINQVLQNYQYLQEEADRIRSTVQHLLNLGQRDKNVNPELLSILVEIIQVLRPGLLGMSFAIS